MPAIFGTTGDDTLTGGPGDTVFGDAGNDVITMNAGGSAYGEAGDDTFLPFFQYPNSSAPTEVNGGAGYDTVSGANLVLPVMGRSGFYYAWMVNAATGELDLSLYGYFFSPPATLYATMHTTGIERIILGGSEVLDLATYTRPIEIVGSVRDNSISGGLAADILRGGDGNDTITVGEGDRVYGDAGNDLLFLGWTTPPSIATLIDGGAGNDTLTLSQTSERFDLVIGAGGFSIGQATFTSVETISVIGSSVGGRTTNITGSDASETFRYTAPSTDRTTVVTFFGGGGDDTLSTSFTENDYLDGGDGNDVIRGIGTLLGGAGDDVIVGTGLLRGGAGNDTLQGVGNQYGDDGDDVMTMTAFEEGSWTFDGGAGVDTLVIRTSSSTTARVTAVDLAAGTLTFGSRTSTVSGIENLTGHDFMTVAETFRGNASNNILRGMSGDDFLYGGGGDDRLEGGTGADRLDGEDGADVLLGEAGDDVMNGGAGADQLDGGAGNDTMTGGDGDDVMVGGVGTDRLEGGAGADQLDGGADGDQLFGGDGDDRLTGGDGGDYMDGGLGDDTAVFTVNSTDVTISRDLANYIIRGTNGLDTVTNVEHLQFLDGTIDLRADGTLFYQPRVLTGTAAADRLVGWAGDDVLNGGAGEDILTGLVGNDTLNGGAGGDLLDGGTGNDTLNGGAGDDLLITGVGDDTVDGGDGDDVVIINANRADVTVTRTGGVLTIQGADGRDTLTGVEHVRFLDGVYDVFPSGDLGAQARVVNGTAGADRLTGTAMADLLLGGAGNDILIGGGGHDLLDGGAGIDTAVFSGVRRQYTIGATMVSGTAAEGSAGDGFDTLVSVEQFGFVDGVLTYDAGSDAARVMRLYSAALGRTPDEAGLSANVAAVGTLGLQGVAGLFVSSAEFQNRFGALDNTQFVQQLYVFALGRTADSAGLNAWLDAMNNGLTRAQVVVGFSESAENVTRTAATLAAGLWVQDAEALMIARLYDATLDRLPDPGGLAGWVALYDGGMSLTQIAQSFVGSPEFQSRYGALSNQQFVEQLYRFCLNREGDAPGIAAQVNALNSGTSRAQLVVNFSESAEHVALTAPLWSGGIRYSGGVAPQPALVEDVDAKGHDAQVSPLIDDGFVTAHDAKDDVVQVSPLADDDALAALHPTVQDLFLHMAQDDRILIVHDAGADALPQIDLTSGHPHGDWIQ